MLCHMLGVGLEEVLIHVSTNFVFIAVNSEENRQYFKDVKILGLSQ